MPSEKTDQLITSTIENTLLHLYGVLAQSTRFVPITKRNDILVRYLKPKIKHPKYKAIKTEIRAMLAIARKNNGNLEQKLWELNKEATKYTFSGNDLQPLFELLTDIHHTHHFESMLLNKDKSIETDIIYINNEHFQQNFTDEGQQIAPLSLFITSSRTAELIDLINQSPGFKATLQSIDKITQQATIELSSYRLMNTYSL
ncbi:DUF2913 family protein [Photobacterium indicum]|uniref:DUF2913 family protein n=1 Tax=Photobacterium indicum TaxID=81447 RepID=UPI003D0F398B